MWAGYIILSLLLVAVLDVGQATFVTGAAGAGVALAVAVGAAAVLGIGALGVGAALAGRRRGRRGGRGRGRGRRSVLEQSSPDGQHEHLVWFPQ